MPQDEKGADQVTLAAWEAFACRHGRRCLFDRGLRWLPPTSGEIGVVTMTETPEAHMKRAIVAPLARFNEAQIGRPEEL